jgi:hypothetical protein
MKNRVMRKPMVVSIVWCAVCGARFESDPYADDGDGSESDELAFRQALARARLHASEVHGDTGRVDGGILN